MQPDPVQILKQLIRCPSVTPDEGGALDFLEGLLKPAGFDCKRLVFSAKGTPDVDNLFARFGDSGPHMCFAGHSDVVPPGNESDWRYPPFDAVVENGVIHGRGACDMKGSLAAFCAAALTFIHDHEGDIGGSVSVLITGDEEGPAINGTVKVLQWMQQNGQLPDECLVGEPTCTDNFGDTIKNGRRGSITFEIRANGIQGHAAYPQLATNPIPAMARLVDALSSTPLDQGTEYFDPSTLAFSTIDTANPAANVTPAQTMARFNIRFNTCHSPASLKAHVKTVCDKISRQTGVGFTISSQTGAECFIGKPGLLLDALQDAIVAETGSRASLSTSGGTSDARFIKDYCPVIEFGPRNETIHQVDECLPVDELAALSRVYRSVIEKFLCRARP